MNAAQAGPFSAAPAVMDTLQIVILVLVALGAAAVVLTRDPVRQAIVLSGYGLVLAVLFLAFQAPDVTLSELVVGAVILPVIVLLTLAKVRKTNGDGGQGQQDGQEGSAAAVSAAKRAKR
jgi:energy-converting hydrogenase B subunit D